MERKSELRRERQWELYRRSVAEGMPDSDYKAAVLAGVLSSALSRAIKWGITAVNPVTNSEPPIPPKRKGMALTTAQQDLLFAGAIKSSL
jgi:hypothetical protein